MTWLGEINTVIVIMALIYWSVSKDFGTYILMGWCIAFLTGWILERRFVQFSTDISMIKRITRITAGLLGYYVVSLIFVPVIRECITGAPGSFISSYLQMFYVSFIFPWIIKHFER
jgi:hypothetical protein